MVTGQVVHMLGWKLGEGLGGNFGEEAIIHLLILSPDGGCVLYFFYIL